MAGCEQEAALLVPVFYFVLQTLRDKVKRKAVQQS